MNLLFLMKYFEVGGQEVVTSVLAEGFAKQGHNTESHLPHYTGKNRQADRGAAPYICKKQAVCFRNYFRKVIYITTATLFVIRIFSEPCLGYHYRFGQCSGRSYFFRNPLHDIKHVCRTSRNSDNRHKPAGGGKL